MTSRGVDDSAKGGEAGSRKVRQGGGEREAVGQQFSIVIIEVLNKVKTLMVITEGLQASA